MSESFHNYIVNHWETQFRTIGVGKDYKTGKSYTVKEVLLKGSKRIDLYRIFDHFNFNIGFEIGVRRGLNAYRIINTIENLDILHLIDPYIDYEGIPEAWGKEVHQECFEESMELLDPVKHWTKRHYLKSEQAYSIFDKKGIKFSFGYIDGEHSFDYVMLDMLLYWRLIRYGGILAGHDYLKRFQYGRVYHAVREFALAHQIPYVYLTDKHPKDIVGIDKGDQRHSWFFVKE